MMIGQDSLHPVRLHDKGHSGVKACSRGNGQLSQMPGAPLSGCVREVADPIPLQRAALDLQQPSLAAPHHVKINPGLPEAEFRYNPVEVLHGQPFAHHRIRRLAVNVKQHTAVLSNRDQVIFRFPCRTVRPAQPDLRPRHQQLPTPPRVLHVDGFFLPGNLNNGNKPIRPLHKQAAASILILHIGFQIKKDSTTAASAPPAA